MSSALGLEDGSPRPTRWWLLSLALPVAGLALLLARPEIDLEWQHHPSHFWIVLITAGASVALWTGDQAQFKRFFPAEIAKWRDVVKKANLKLD